MSPQTAEPAGRTYWRSFEQLEGSPHFQEILRREFPEGVTDGPGFQDDVSRRKFLGVVAASAALAGMTGCRKPRREILPFTQRPQGRIPGIPLHYATAFEQCGYAIGAVVRSNDGRPTKVEGNPGHPASKGGTNAFMQAEVLQLYDPARSRSPVHNQGGVANEASLQDFSSAVRPTINALAGEQGEGLHVLMPPTTSPTMARMVGELSDALPKARVHAWAPVHRDGSIAAGKLAFGAALDVQPRFENAAVVASFDCDFLGLEARSLGWVRDYAQSRKITETSGDVSRLYAVEASFTLTGSNADHRFRIPSGRIGEAVFALATELGVGETYPELAPALAPFAGQARRFTRSGKSWVQALAADLRSKAGRGMVLVGDRQPAEVQAVGHAINLVLGNVGGPGEQKPLAFTETADAMARAGGDAAIASLAAAMDAGQVDTLVCLGSNPVYDAPAELGFREALQKVAHKIHLGNYRDETAALCDWHVNGTSELEAWGDSLAWDGTASVAQPLIAPLYGGVSAIELIAHLIENDDTEGYVLVRKTWQDSEAFGATGSDDFDAWFRRALHDGVIAATASTPVAVPTLRASAIAQAIRGLKPTVEASLASLEINFRPCPTVFDGRYANNSWMQELPGWIDKLTWDNAVVMSPATARDLGVGNGDVVALGLDGRSVDAPVWIVPGHADLSVTVTLGYGRRLGDECRVAAGTGFDSYAIRTSAAAQFGSGLTVTKTGRSYDLVSAQDHGSLEGRPIVRESDLETFRRDPDFVQMMSPLARAAAHEGKNEEDLAKSLWEERDYSTGYQWGMVIDLNSCVGCNACVVACTAENNIPMVGKAQVAVGREMFWNRIDRYFVTPEGTGADADPQVVYQMVPCMQCENAPCESVCPVAATIHSPEGLNDMAYNRCIGTRYCSNNCPYKVRRFNWFNFHKGLTASDTRKMAFNPDVTVRARGVMEKCTYCVQRINAAKFATKSAGRTVEDGDLQTACQQGCPADAIAFGNILDRDTRVHRWRASKLEYAMLGELNVKPRTTYLAKIRNPNPELS